VWNRSFADVCAIILLFVLIHEGTFKLYVRRTTGRIVDGLGKLRRQSHSELCCYGGRRDDCLHANAEHLEEQGVLSRS
jgi:hypothetical protein